MKNLLVLVAVMMFSGSVFAAKWCHDSNGIKLQKKCSTGTDCGYNASCRKDSKSMVGNPIGPIVQPIKTNIKSLNIGEKPNYIPVE